MMRLRLTVKGVQLLKIKVQVSSIRAKWCILMILCVCVGVCLLVHKRSYKEENSLSCEICKIGIERAEILTQCLDHSGSH